MKVQVSLSLLLIGAFVWALMSLITFSTPDYLAVPMLGAIGILTPAALTGGIIYGRAGLRAFCIGALFPAAGSFFLWFMWVVPELTFENNPSYPYSDYVEWVSDNAISVRCLTMGTWSLGLLAGLVVLVIYAASPRKLPAK